MGTDAVSPLGRAGEAAQQLHAISAGGASKLKWETVPVPIFPPVRGEFYALAEAISFNVKSE